MKCSVTLYSSLFLVILHLLTCSNNYLGTFLRNSRGGISKCAFCLILTNMVLQPFWVACQRSDRLAKRHGGRQRSARRGERRNWQANLEAHWNRRKKRIWSLSTATTRSIEDRKLLPNLIRLTNRKLRPSR